MTTLILALAAVVLAIAFGKIQAQKQELRLVSKEADGYLVERIERDRTIVTLDGELVDAHDSITSLIHDSASLRQTVAVLDNDNAAIRQNNVAFAEGLARYSADNFKLAGLAKALKTAVLFQDKVIIAQEVQLVADEIALSVLANYTDQLENELDEQDEQIRDAGIFIDDLTVDRNIAVESLNFLVDGIASVQAKDAAYVDAVEKHNAELLTLVQRYDNSAEKFIKKVDSGRARLTETYLELKAVYKRAPVEAVETIDVVAQSADEAAAMVGVIQ